MNTDYIIEVATSDYTTTQQAVSGGADRIELCANLAEGGTTPSFGTIKKCREDFDVLLYPIIRPRGGDFLYSNEEFEIMLQDIKMCKDIACDGVVIGMLDNLGNVDVIRTNQLVKAAYPLNVTFHRAFDRCKDPSIALEQLIECGCERILTSGQKPSIMDGISLVKELNDIANDRIVIMPGSGVRPQNIVEIKEKTGCKEFHASLRSKIRSSMQYVNPDFNKDPESYCNNFIDSNDVKKMKIAVNQ